MSTSGEAVGPMPGGPPGMPVFNPNPSKGLQPLIITLLYLCPGIAGLIVLVRIIKKRIDRTLGGGKFLSILPEDSVLTPTYRRCTDRAGVAALLREQHYCTFL